MTVDSILELAGKIIDVLLVWALLYYALKSLRKNVKMVMLFSNNRIYNRLYNWMGTICTNCYFPTRN